MTKSIENLKWRYATKNFDASKNLDAQQLEMLAAAFNLTATSYGLQPCRMIVLQNRELMEKMVPMAFGQRQVVDAAAVLVLCTTVVDSDYVKNYFDRVKGIRDTSDEVLQPFVDQLTGKFDAMAVEEVEERKASTMYTTGEHCPMCAAAHGWSAIGTLVYLASGKELKQWYAEMGHDPAPIEFLPVQEILKNIEVKQVATPQMLEQIRDMHVQSFKRSGKS